MAVWIGNLRSALGFCGVFFLVGAGIEFFMIKVYIFDTNFCEHVLCRLHVVKIPSVALANQTFLPFVPWEDALSIETVRCS